MPAANNYLVDLLEAEGAEAVMPDLMGFLLYCAENANFKKDYLGASKKSAFINNSVIKLLEWFRKGAKQALKESKRFYTACYDSGNCKPCQRFSFFR